MNSNTWLAVAIPCCHMTHPRNQAALSLLTGHLTAHRDVVKEVLSQLRKLLDKLPPSEDLISIMGVLILILLFLALTLNVRTGPQGQVMGTVHGTTFAQGDGSVSKVVSVHLHNGDLVTIVVSPNQVLQPGQVIVLDVYRRFLTGSLTYGMAPYNKQPTPETVPSLQRKALP